MLEWDQESEEFLGVKLKILRRTTPLDTITHKGVGVDPGRNFGIAIVDPEMISVYYGNLHINRSWTYADDGWFACELVYHLLSKETPPILCAVEGAAHSLHKGQAALATIRMGFYMGCRSLGWEVKLTAPNSARKAATGHGRVPMADLLPSMNTDAAAAIGLALYAAGYSASSS